MNSLKRLCWAGAVLGLALHVLPAQAASSTPPNLMTYQGYLVDNNGTPLGNTAPKNYDVIFRIYAEQIGGGDPLWAEQQTITIDKGYFSVLLGEGGPAGGPTAATLPGLFTGPTASDRYIEIVVKGIGTGGTDVTITPRLRFLASPYAFLAQTAVNAQNLVSGTNPVVNVSGANVGINKASPTSALDVNGTVKATNFSGSGSSLTSLNANNLSSGTVADARLSANVAKLNTIQTFTADNTFAENLQIGSHSNDPQHLQIGGGNSSGYLYGCYSQLGDGIHLGYNHYFDGTGGHLIRTGGATSRLTLGYGKIVLATDGNDAPPSPRLVVDASGYIGIGTISPGFPLNFASTLGDKISLWGNSGNHYGFGVQSSTLQIYGDVNTSKIVFGYGQSTNLTETMRIQGNGNVGIGTTAPAGKLDVNGTIKVKGLAPIMIRKYGNLSSSYMEGNNNTGVSTADYSAAVVGFTSSGGFHDLGTGALIQIYMAQSGGTWRIWFKIRADDVTNVSVDVMFIRRELTDDNRT